MCEPETIAALTELGLVRLSKSIFMSDMHSKIAQVHDLLSGHGDPSLEIEVDTRLCEDLLEPLQLRGAPVGVRLA